jgi:hypothetical protein
MRAFYLRPVSSAWRASVRCLRTGSISDTPRGALCGQDNVTDLIEAGEVLNSFFDNRHNIIEGIQPGNENDEESAWGPINSPIPSQDDYMDEL